MRQTGKTTNGAERFDSENGVIAVRLHGTWEQMGCQYGFLLAPELVELCAQVTPLLTPEVEQNTRLYHAGQPARVHSIFRGMARGSKLSLDELYTTDALEFLYATTARCSAGAAWGHCTTDSTLIFGRNYDWFRDDTRPTPPLVVSVWNPADGSLPFAMVAWVGLMYITTGMNSAGLFIELNAEVLTGTTYDFAQRVFSPSVLMSILNDSETLYQAEVQLRTARPFAQFIIGMADAEEARFYAWGTDETRLMSRPGNGSPALATNHFTNSFGTPDTRPQIDTFASRRRYCILDRQLRRYSGQIDTTVMREIMTGDIASETGPAFGNDPKIKTFYHVVAQPEPRILWVKNSEHTAWVKLRLTELFL